MHYYKQNNKKTIKNRLVMLKKTNLISGIFLGIALSACSMQSTKQNPVDVSSTAMQIVIKKEVEPTSGEVISEFSLKFTDKDTQANNQLPVIKFETNFGSIYVVLYRDRAPITVDNFLSYTVEGRYDNTVFQRVIKNFLIQGGAYYTDDSEIPDFGPIPTESGNGLIHKKYTLGLAMWKRNAASRHFYFNMKDNFYLDPKEEHWGVAIFGKVIQGHETLDKIHLVKTDDYLPLNLVNTPIEQVIIHKVTLLSEADAASLLAQTKQKYQSKNE